MGWGLPHSPFTSEGRLRKLYNAVAVPVTMSPKQSKASRKIRGAQKWILDELRTLRPSVRLSTSEIAKKISKTRGKSFHKNSIYNALRILVQRGHVVVVRDGHEKFYQASGAAMTSPSTGDSGSRIIARTSPSMSASSDVPTGMLPHKLALGEILVIGIDGREVITATNLHGRLVLERHPVPG